jgi:probable rRNA maturation factor
VSEFARLLAGMYHTRVEYPSGAGGITADLAVTRRLSERPPEVLVSGRSKLSATRVRRIVRKVLAAERRRATVSVTFLGPTRMRRLNQEYKGHDRPTDVISFHLPGPDGSLAGDIYICPAVAAREAKAAGVTQTDELARLSFTAPCMCWVTTIQRVGDCHFGSLATAGTIPEALT